jgi:hypothetical protein
VKLHPGCLPPGKIRYPWYRRRGWPEAGLDGYGKSYPPPRLGFDPRTVQPVASCYTDWAVAAVSHIQYKILLLFLQAAQTFFFCGAAAQRAPRPPLSWDFWNTHKDASQSVGLLWTNDQLVAETSTWQQTNNKDICITWKKYNDWYSMFIYHFSCKITHKVKSQFWHVYAEHPVYSDSRINTFLPLRNRPHWGKASFLSKIHNHTQTHHTLLCTSDWPRAEISTWEHKTLIRDRHPCPGGIRTQIPASKWLQTQTLDRMATGIGTQMHYCRNIQ